MTFETHDYGLGLPGRCIRLVQLGGGAGNPDTLYNGGVAGQISWALRCNSDIFQMVVTTQLVMLHSINPNLSDLSESRF